MALAYKRSLTCDHTLCGSADSTSFTVLFRSPVGTVNTSGTSVTLATGDSFPSWLTDSIGINGTVYTISSWNSSSSITLGSSAGTQTGVAYCGTPWAATAANGGKVQSSGGSPARPYDLEFFSDSGLTSPLSGWEIEGWVAATGEFQIWGIVGTLTHSSDLVFYVGYDDAGVASYQGGSTGAAWDSHTIAAYHFPDGSTLGLNDSSANALNLTNNSATATTGQIDGGIAFNGSTQYASHADAAALDPTSQITVSAWAKRSRSATREIFIGKGAFNSPADSQFYLQFSADDTLRFYLSQNNTTDKPLDTSVSVTDTTAFHLYHGTYDATTQRAYKDGTVAAATATWSGPLGTDNQAFAVGRPGALNALYFQGSMDEARIADTARSQSWITAEYNNQSSPHTFITVGAETATGGGGRGLFYPSPLSGLGSGGSFFSDRLAA